MKCPICGETLKPSKKDSDYLLCYTCKKKFKVPQSQETVEDRPAPKKVSREQAHAPKKASREQAPASRKTSREQAHAPKKASGRQQYSNIPPKEVRDKREREMKKAYDEMLAIEDEKVSKAPVIILAIAIVIVAALIVYMMFFK